MDGFSDLAFFALVAKCGSLAGAAQELGITPPAGDPRRTGIRPAARGTRRSSRRGRLSSNDGESAIGWALDGHGIVLRSVWEAAPHLASGRLRAVLPDWRLPPADIHAVFATRSHLAAKTRALIDFLVEAFAPYRHQADGDRVAW